MIMLHMSKISSSHGTAERNLHASLQTSRSLCGRIKSSESQSLGTVHITSGIPLGTLSFFVGRMRWLFQTSLMSSNSSYQTKIKNTQDTKKDDTKKMKIHICWKRNIRFILYTYVLSYSYYQQVVWVIRHLLLGGGWGLTQCLRVCDNGLNLRPLFPFITMWSCLQY